LLREAAANPNDTFYHDRLADAPRQEHDVYWDAFWELNDERHFAEGAIPPSRAWQYAREHDWPISEQRAFVYIIRRMDRELAQIRAEQMKATKPT